MYSNQVPRIESQRATEMTDQPTVDEAQGDLLVNNLIYKQPKALSLAKTRTHVKQFFQRSDYPSAANKTAVIDWNTGASYIDVGNSYLGFSIVALSADQLPWSFGDGSAMNIISRITIRSRSGTELERLEGANLWSKLDIQYSLPKNFADTMGSAMGMESQTTLATSPLNRITYSSSLSGGTPDQTYNINLLIPLKNLCTFFRPLKGQLLPPQLASGLHVEIVFENTSTAFFKPPALGSPVTDYNVNNIHFLLDTVELSDETQKTLNMESADNGLEWVTPRIYTAITSIPIGQSQVSVQVRKSCSQATMAYSVLQNSSKLTDVTVDSMKSEPIGNTLQFQYRIGSLFYPQQPVVQTLNNFYGVPTSYYEALYAFDKPKHPYNECNVSSRKFVEDSAIFAMTASKNDDLYLSGVPVNNSRVLEFNLTTEAAIYDRRLTSMLEYIQVVKCFIDNTSVAI
jgi:hypothetical protein